VRAERGEPRLSRWLRIILRMAGIAAVLGMVLWVLWRDELPPDDADLRNYRRVVKDEDNGFRLICLTFDDVAWPEDEEGERLVHGESRTFDREKAAELATSNASVIEKIDQALARRDLQTAALEDMNAPVHDLRGWRRAAHSLSSRSRLRLEEGDAEAAYEDAMRLVRLGSRIQQAQGTLIDYLVGTAVQGIGNQRLAHMAVHGRFPLQVLRRGIEDLAPEVHRRGLGDAFKAEYVEMSSAFDGIVAGTISDLGCYWRAHFRYSLKPNQTKRLLAEGIRALIEFDAMPALGRKALDLSAYDTSATWEMLLSRRAGIMALGFLLPSYEKAISQADIAHWNLAATRTLLAIAAYRAEKGSIPGSLGALVPEYLEAPALDPYTGKHFLYSAEKMVLYSPGADGFDSGGSTREDAWGALTDYTEPTLRLDPAAWKYIYE